MKRLLIIYLVLFINSTLSAQIIYDQEINKCGTDLKAESNLLDLYGDHWGYSYDSLLNDLTKWESSDYVIVNSIGLSTLDRELYELTITDCGIPDTEKHRIYIHARTHPGEIQSFEVTNEIINLLLNDTEIGNFLRTRCIFHIIPMYNPDGVELEYARENANGIDIESNWNKVPGEIEVVNLRNRFSELMQEDNPIEIALNMHSAYACKRYFVFHHPYGTSAVYSNMQQDFIASVRSHFIDGIEPYNYYISWSNGTPDRYPESWWWLNHAEEVMALTYEDMNCASAGFYEKTAYAILHGISDYLELGFSVSNEDFKNHLIETRAFPNPFSEQVVVEWNTFDMPESAYITDIYGRQVFVFSKQEASSGKLSWNGNNQNNISLSGGMYILNLVFEDQLKSVILIKQ